jgi:uncharacterized membrane protein YeaQ/YmgE (transglycosylase-associated protein family)
MNIGGTKTTVQNHRFCKQAAWGKTNMIGMGFISFLILLIISVAVSAILHYQFKYYVTPGHWSFCSKVVVGWIGAWLGSPIFGYWPNRIPNLHYENVWYIPAILGALALIIVAVDVATMATMRGGARRKR